MRSPSTLPPKSPEHPPDLSSKVTNVHIICDRAYDRIHPTAMITFERRKPDIPRSSS
jgi:hypothetical protein